MKIIEEFLQLMFSSKVAMVLIISLFIIDIFISWAIVRLFNPGILGMKFSQGLNSIKERYTEQKISDSVRALTKTVHIKLSFFEKLEIKYVDKPLLRNIMFFANIYVVLFISFVLFLAIFFYSYLNICSTIISFSFGLISASIPFVLLDLRSKQMSERVRKMMATWVSSLNKAADFKADVQYVLKYSVSIAQDPLKTYIKECVIQLENGLNASEAFELLSMKVDSKQFKDFILNLKQICILGGDIKNFLARCEDQFYKLEEEYESKKVKTLGSRILIYAVMLIFVPLILYLFHVNPAAKVFYLTNSQGRLISSSFICLYFGSFVLSTKITNFNY